MLWKHPALRLQRGQPASHGRRKNKRMAAAKPLLEEMRSAGQGRRDCPHIDEQTPQNASNRGGAVAKVMLQRRPRSMMRRGSQRCSQRPAIGLPICAVAWRGDRCDPRLSLTADCPRRRRGIWALIKKVEALARGLRRGREHSRALRRAVTPAPILAAAEKMVEIRASDRWKGARVWTKRRRPSHQLLDIFGAKDADGSRSAVWFRAAGQSERDGEPRSPRRHAIRCLVLLGWERRRSERRLSDHRR